MNGGRWDVLPRLRLGFLLETHSQVFMQDHEENVGFNSNDFLASGHLYTDETAELTTMHIRSGSMELEDWKTIVVNGPATVSYIQPLSVLNAEVCFNLYYIIPIL